MWCVLDLFCLLIPTRTPVSPRMREPADILTAHGPHWMMFGYLCVRYDDT